MVLLAVNLLAGCRSDIVCTERMKLLDHKCVYIEPLKTEEASIGRVLRDVLEKEFVRRQIRDMRPRIMRQCLSAVQRF